MAVVSFEREDLENLIGKKLSKEELEEKIPMMGCPFEGEENGEVTFEVFPDRPDMLSVEGFSREVRKFLKIDSGVSTYKTKKSGIKIKVSKSVSEVRPKITAAVVRDVKLTDEMVASLMQIQEKLHETLGRKREKVAIGVHDLDKIEAPFTYKAVNPSKKSFVPLDMENELSMKKITEKHPKGIEYKWILENKKKWPLIVDKNKNVISFPPIINGELTRVTGNTKNIFIDVTGTSQKAIDQALNILVTSFHERGCSIETVDISGKEKPDLSKREIKINIDYLNKLLDSDFTNEEINEIISKMGLEYKKGKVIYAPYRTDIMHPIDIVEDAAIGRGYENFEARIPDVPTIGKSMVKKENINDIKQIFIGLGFQETISMILTNTENEFDKNLLKEEPHSKTKKPASQDYSICRKRIFPSLLKILSENKHNQYPQKIFEIGKVVNEGGKDRIKLSAAMTDNEIGYEDVSSLTGTLSKNLGKKMKLEKTDHPTFIKGRCAKVSMGQGKGTLGEVNPAVLENWNIEKPVVMLELEIDKII